MSKNAIELRHVSRSFGDFGISDLNLTLPSGCILGLMGENGAGKSTTIRLLMDTLRRDSGEIFVLGVDNTAPEFQRVKQDIGVVLDEARFPETLNARELEQVLALTYTNWESDTFRRYMDPLPTAGEKAVQGLLPGHENEAGHCGGAEPSGPAAHSG